MARGILATILAILLMATASMGSGLPQWLGGKGAEWRKELAAAETAKDSDAVIELAKRILAADPRDAGVWTELVQAQIETSDYDRALGSLAAWEKAVKSRAAAIDDFRGDIYLAKGDDDANEKAEKAWRAALAVEPANYVVLSKLADLLEKQERWPEVFALRTRAAAAKPTAAMIAAESWASLHLHQWDAASAEIQKANKLDATDATVQQWLPKLEQLAVALPKIKALDAQIAAKPRDIHPLLDEAWIFTTIDEAPLALSNCKRAMALDPGSIHARVETGEAYLDMNDIDGAAGVKVSHDLPLGFHGPVTPQIYGELDRLDAEVEQNRGQPGPLAARSKALRSINQYVLALEDAKAALRADRNSPEAEFEMGHDLDGLGKPGEALPHIVRATELSPNNPVAWYYRGVVEANRADYRAAIESQTHSLSIRESSVAYSARADCELRLGMAAQAAADTQQAQRLASKGQQ